MTYKIGGTTVIDDSRNLCNITSVATNSANVTTELTIPVGTTATRPVTPGSGSLRYNTTTSKPEIYNQGAWSDIGGARTQSQPLATDSTTAWNISQPFTCFQYFQGVQLCGANNIGNPRSAEWHPGTNVSEVCIKCVFTAESCFYDNSNACFSGVLGKPLNASCCNAFFCLTCKQETCNTGGRQVGYTASPSGPCYGCCTCAFFVVYGGGEIESAYSTRCSPFLGIGYFLSQCGNCCATLYTSELYFNRCGAASVRCKAAQWLIGPACSIACCLDYYSLPSLAYSRIDFYGNPVASVTIPVCSWKTGACAMRCMSYFTVTENTFGTGSEETCCYAFRTVSTCPCDGPMTTPIYNIACMLVCVGDVANTYPCQACINSTRFGFTSCCRQWCRIGQAFSPRTDLFGGGSPRNRELYCRSLCCYCVGNSLGLCESYWCSADVPMVVVGFSNCGDSSSLCIVDSTASGGPGHLLLSCDGCCLVGTVWRAAGQSVESTICCCFYDCASAALRLCYCNLFRSVTTVIDRVNQCVITFFGNCCAKFTDFECTALGCVKGTSSMPAYQMTWNCVAAEVTFCCGPPQAKINYMQCGMSRSFICNMDCMWPEELSYLTWSKLSNKAYLTTCDNNVCYPSQFKLFVYCGTTNSWACKMCLNLNCAFRDMAASFSSKPCHLCMGALPIAQGSCPCVGLLYVNCTNVSVHAGCIQAITGSAIKSLMHHCLGYALFSGNESACFALCYTCLVSPTSIGFDSGNAYLNPTNDHMVFFLSYGWDGSCAVSCPGSITCVSWVGAVCYDITNCCVSKVNTLYPNLDVMSKFCCACFAKTATEQVSYEFNLPRGWGTACVCTGFCNTGILVRHYGTKKLYTDSGCTDMGGMYIIQQGMCGAYCVETCCCIPNAYTCYFDCCQTGKCHTGYVCGIALKSNPGDGVALTKVPYSTPLECIGWRSEPFFACMLNWVMDPFGSCKPFGDIVSGACCCSLIERQMSCRFAEPPQCKVTNCSWCLLPQHGSFIRQDDQILLMKCNFVIRNNCSGVTGGTEGTMCPITWATYYGYQLTNIASAIRMYDNILPCHLDCTNTTNQRFICQYMRNNEPVQPLNFYNGGSPIAKWMINCEGEDFIDRFVRAYNEDVINCC